MPCRPWSVALLMVACLEPSREPLVDHALWSQVDAQDDPFDDRPAEVHCPSGAWALEVDPEPALEVSTASCDYLTLTQETVVDARGGDILVIRVVHEALAATTSAEAHVAVRLADRMLLDRRVDIPSEAAEHDVRIELTDDLPAGTPVWFHLHNHGANAWTLSELSIGP